MKKWNDEKIKNEIIKVIQTLKIDRFPTVREMNTVTGNNGLTCAISRNNGYLYWCKKLNMQPKQSDTFFGNKYELLAMKDIKKNTELDCLFISGSHPYDLLVNGIVKIDVKAAKIYERKNGVGSYEFELRKKEPTSDVYLFYCLNKEEKIIKTLVIPSFVFIGHTHVGFGKTSRYDCYQDNWECIKKINEFYQNM